MHLEEVLKKEPSATMLMELMLTDFDELVEIDMENDRCSRLKHKEGKYFVPMIDCGFRELFRYSADYMAHPEDRERYIAENDPDRICARIKAGENNGVLTSRFRYKLLNGGYHYAEQVAVGGKAFGMRENTYYAFLFDINDQMGDKADEACTETEDGYGDAERSALTGLLNEDAFFKLAPDFLKNCAEDWCLLAIDIEHFKMFNEWYGRTQGDFLLARIGAKLLRLEREVGGMACHYGQDDFAIILPQNEERINALYDELHGIIKDYGTSVGFMPAFGIAEIDKKLSAYELYDRASLAARRAKDDYHTRIRVFDPSMILQTDREYRILSDFQKALNDHELFIQMQPQCQISTEKIVGAESLVRWKKADGTLVSPGVFVPVLEHYGFVTDLDEYVWEEVCRWQRKWIDGGHTPLPISVNVSQIDIYTIDVADFFERLIEKYGLPADVIKIEITESAYVDNTAVADTVSRLREKGFVVLMDDFGSGYSSLNMLRNLSVDIIKLDAQFLRMSGDDQKGVHIMESIVNMAKTMGVPVIVEGVETQEESDFLSRLGCRYVQGYFFYRPMAVEDFEKLIADPEHIDTGGFRFKVQEQFHTREFLDQNVFSDTVLNNILGPVAFYSWHGDDVDVVRFNQQFYDEFKMPNFQKHMNGIQHMMPQEDLPKLHGILQRAMDAPAEGARGELRFNRPDGTISQFRVRFFFLKEDENGKRFYGSIHDLTDFITLNDHVRLLSRVNPDSIIFMRRLKDHWSARVVIHGLKDEIGLSREELQQELDDGKFYERVEPDSREQLMGLTTAPDKQAQEYSAPFHLRTPQGEPIELKAWFFGVHDKASGVEYILVLRKRGVAA